jgi:hypothetical protein
LRNSLDFAVDLQRGNFAIHTVIHRGSGRKGAYTGGFSGFFQKKSDLSTVSTGKTVHNVDKCKIYASLDIGIFLTIVDKLQRGRNVI